MVCIYIDVCTGVKYLQQSCVFILSCISLKIKHKNGYTLERSQVHLGDDNVAALNNIVILFYSIFLRHGYRQSSNVVESSVHRDVASYIVTVPYQ